MFHSMRYLGSSIFAKVLVVLISIAFIFWGIGDVLRQGGTGYAARVGDATISIAEFQHQRNMVDRQMQAYGMKDIDPNKLSVAVLRQLVQQQLLAEEMHRLGLYVNEPLLAQSLRKQPQFIKPDGSFNAGAFKNTLLNSHTSEAAFLDQLQHEIAGKFLIASMDMTDAAPPATAIDIAATVAGETRDAVLITVPAHVPEGQLTDAAVRSYYEEHKLLYLTPQSRTLEYVTLAPGEMDKWIDQSITAEARADAAKPDPSASPEKLAMQLRADARETAMRNLSDSIQDALAGGATFGGAMSKLGLKASSHMLENITADNAKTHTDEVEKTAIEQGMALDDGGISGVITTPHGTTLMVAVKSINPSAPQPFEAVAAQARVGLSQQLARDNARSKAREVKDALTKANAAQWQTVLGKFGLAGRPVSNLARPVEGKPNGYGIPDPLHQAIFERKAGDVAGPLTLPDGSQMIAIVTGIHHPKTALDDKARDALNKSLMDGLNQDIENAAFVEFGAQHPVKINPQLGNQSVDAAP